jgi:hypothetical protein
MATVPPEVAEPPALLERGYHGVLCFAWLCMIASVPVTVAVIEDHVTWVHISQTCVVFSFLIVGTYLLTQVTHFTSGYWEGARTLTLPQTIYLLAQIFTTIGYGDIVPAFPPGRLIIGCYALFSCIFYADQIAHFCALGSARAEKAAKTQANADLANERVAAGRRGSVIQYSSGNLTAGKQQALPQGLKNVALHYIFLQTDARKRQIAWCLFVFVLLAVSGTTFFCTFPGEGKTVTAGVYMSVITLSTIGFGDVTAATESGRIFSAYWMALGALAFLQATSVMSEMAINAKKRLKAASKEGFEEVCDSLQLNEDDSLDRYDFMRFALLRSNLVKPEDLERIEQTFGILTLGQSRAEGGEGEEIGVSLSALKDLIIDEGGDSMSTVPTEQSVPAAARILHGPVGLAAS